MKKFKLLLFVFVLIIVDLAGIYITSKVLKNPQILGLYITIAVVYGFLYFYLPHKKMILSQDNKILIQSAIDVANFINKSIIFTNIFFQSFNIYDMIFQHKKINISWIDLVFSVGCLISLFACFYMNNYIQLQLDSMINKIEIKSVKITIAHKKVIPNFEKIITGFWLCILIFFIVISFFYQPLLFILLVIYVFIFIINIWAFFTSFKISHPISILTILDSSDFFLKTIFIIPIFKNLLHQHSIYTPIEFWAGFLVLFISIATINKAKLNLKNNSK